MKKVVVLVVIMSIFFSGCADDKRDPISFKQLDWNRLSIEKNILEVELIEVTTKEPKESYLIQNVYFTDFGSFMKENATTYEEDGEGRIKIYYRFKEDGWFNNVYDATEYEGKACTFYLDEKDLVTLEKWKQKGTN